MPITLERLVRITAVLACAAVATLFAIFAVTGVGQDPLQFVHPRDIYATLLLAHPSVLRAVLATDNIFIVFYMTMFFALGAVLRRIGSSTVLVVSATALLILAGTLDLIENQHFLVMLTSAEQGQLPGVVEIGLQVLESLVKFHVSYLGLSLLGAAVPRRNVPERLLANQLWFVQLPVGILIYVTPAAVAFPLVIVRTLSFVSGLGLIAWSFGSRGDGAGSNAPA